ncbi:uncharacterized protein LOC125666363 [Ostrea edulis]|uniref:uncharacterized protein LOC125666363 n=1 Tax=Ostrea edulis TaxID=37623 RepID=UPI0020953B1C|nr:uncharacterized protein LOC125666363 [Ostrea edulis]
MSRIFGIQCSEVEAALISQIQEWSTATNCQDDKCNYEITEDELDSVRVKHRVTSLDYINAIIFRFRNGTNGCHVNGFSISINPYAYFDGSTNYCGMHTLITGSSLDQEPEYQEMTSEKICTQYSIANCS